ncbi:MAG: hypothetical protein WCF99_07820 [Chloroflexales bacterium]
MALDISYLPTPRPLESVHSTARYQIVEQLRYVGAILEMLEVGTWNAAAGILLDARISVIDTVAGQMGWSTLRHTMADLRHELATCVQYDRAPDPTAMVALRTALTHVLTPARSSPTG